MRTLKERRGDDVSHCYPNTTISNLPYITRRQTNCCDLTLTGLDLHTDFSSTFPKHSLNMSMESNLDMYLF